MQVLMLVVVDGMEEIYTFLGSPPTKNSLCLCTFVDAHACSRCCRNQLAWAGTSQTLGFTFYGWMSYTLHTGNLEYLSLTIIGFIETSDERLQEVCLTDEVQYNESRMQQMQFFDTFFITNGLMGHHQGPVTLPGLQAQSLDQLAHQKTLKWGWYRWSLWNFGPINAKKNPGVSG